MTAAAVGQAALLAYAILLAVGGVMGFIKAGSKVSMIAGLASAALVAVAFGVAVAGPNPRDGFLVGLSVSVVLILMFLQRFLKTRKWMPAGLLLTVSAVMAVLLLSLLTVAAPA
jgi:uncharacterized membrane protein (UPF0136 family)